MLESFGGRPGMYGVMDSVASLAAAARATDIGLGKETHPLPHPPPARYLRLMCNGCTVSSSFAKLSPIAAPTEDACKTICLANLSCTAATWSATASASASAPAEGKAGADGCTLISSIDWQTAQFGTFSQPCSSSSCRTWIQRGNNTMAGLGLMPEGIEENPVMFALMMDNLWGTPDNLPTAPIDLRTWMHGYVSRRYAGAVPVQAFEAWGALRTSVYSAKSSGARGWSSCCPQYDAMQMPMGFTVDGDKFAPNPAGDKLLQSDTDGLLKAWGLLIAAAKAQPSLANQKTFTMDLAVVGLTSLGQVSGTGVVREIAAAYQANNHSAFERAAVRMNALIEGMDAIAGTQEDLLLGRHLRRVRQWGQKNGTSVTPERTCQQIAATIKIANLNQHQCVPEDTKPVDPAFAKCEIEGCCYTFAAALNKSVCIRRRNQTFAQGYVRTAVQLVTLHGTQVSQNSDYATRFWAGLLGSYHGGRWKRWFEDAGAAMLQNTTFDQPAWQLSMGAWVEDWIDSAGNTQQFAVEPSGDLLEISTRLLAMFKTEPPLCPPASPPAGPPAGTDSLGCYADAAGGGRIRDLPKLAEGKMPASAQPVEQCGQACNSSFRYIGLQDGDECWCGNSFGSQGKLADKYCNKPCLPPGDNTSCGGPGANSVWVNPVGPNAKLLMHAVSSCSQCGKPPEGTPGSWCDDPKCIPFEWDGNHVKGKDVSAIGCPAIGMGPAHPGAVAKTYCLHGNTHKDVHAATVFIPPPPLSPAE